MKNNNTIYNLLFTYIYCVCNKKTLYIEINSKEEAMRLLNQLSSLDIKWKDGDYAVSYLPPFTHYFINIHCKTEGLNDELFITLTPPEDIKYVLGKNSDIVTYEMFREILVNMKGTSIKIDDRLAKKAKVKDANKQPDIVCADRNGKIRSCEPVNEEAFKKVIQKVFDGDKNTCLCNLKPERIIYRDPATIVWWNDGTKTVVKCNQDADIFDEYLGFCAALAKKIYGSNCATTRMIDRVAEVHDKVEHVNEDQTSDVKSVNACEAFYDRYVENEVVPPRSEVDEITSAAEAYEWDEQLGICYKIPNDNAVIEKYQLREDPDNEGWYYNPKYV